MSKSTIRNKIFIDSLKSVAGSVFMTCAAQFLLYPFWERNYGVDKYGTIIYFLSLMNIVSITFGTAIGYTRIMLSANRKTNNNPYLVLLAYVSILTVLYSVIIVFISPKDFSVVDGVGFIILCVLTIWRCYSDVEYRIHLNYTGYFLYYFFIGLGYIAGLLWVKFFDSWTISLITGECFGLLYILIRGHIFRKEVPAENEMTEIRNLFVVLFGSYFINTLIFNADRILLKNTVGSIAVSTYYVASLFGKTLSLITTPLNGVISGYLVRLKDVPKKKIRLLLILIALVMSVLFALACTLAAYIILPFIYSEAFEKAKGIVFVSCLAQTVYFSTNILSVFMLRFANKRHQVISNTVYAVSFIICCIPLSIIMEMKGFLLGLLITSLSRFVYNSVIVISLRKNIKRENV